MKFEFYLRMPSAYTGYAALQRGFQTASKRKEKIFFFSFRFVEDSG
jgi:hypothetical protein